MRTLTTKSIRIFLALLAVSVLPALTVAQQVETHVNKWTGHADTGKQLYFRYCWGCHGFRGDGNGENAPYLNILPRNFVAATFKCRSTPTGTLPTDQDLRHHRAWYQQFQHALVDRADGPKPRRFGRLASRLSRRAG